MFNLVESGQVQAPLWSPATSVPAGMTNQTYLREYLATKFRAAFPQLNKCVPAGRPIAGMTRVELTAALWVRVRAHGDWLSNRAARKSSSLSRACSR